MSRILLTALAGVVLLTGCPAPGGDSGTPGTSDKPGETTPGETTPVFETSIMLSLSGAVLRVAHVETSLVKLEGEAEVLVPGTTLNHDRADFPLSIPLTDLRGESTYRLKAQAYDASKQAVASGSTDIVVADDMPPASQTLALSILEVPFAGSVSQP